jgi:hypothetical protein
MPRISLAKASNAVIHFVIAVMESRWLRKNDNLPDDATSKARLPTFYEHHKDSIKIGYRCFDLILLNGLMQPFEIRLSSVSDPLGGKDGGGETTIPEALTGEPAGQPLNTVINAPIGSDISPSYIMSDTTGMLPIGPGPRARYQTLDPASSRLTNASSLSI